MHIQPSYTISEIQTPLGKITAIADEKNLYHLAFTDQIHVPATITRGHTRILDSITSELNEYFAGTLTEFKTPIHLHGTPFQISVWNELTRIPFGHTRSYKELACALGRPTAFRAVANANGANCIAIVIPCHRIINANGNRGGYNGGIERKKWLLEHEARISRKVKIET